MRAGKYIACGKKLRELRIQRGLTLEDMITKLEKKCSDRWLIWDDEKTLRDIEAGIRVRPPKRGKLIALCVFGFELTDVREINEVLNLASLKGLIPNEIDTYGLKRESIPEQFLYANAAAIDMIRESRIPIYAFDLDGNVQVWNSAAERLFGWRRDEVLNRRLPFIQGDFDFRVFHNYLERLKECPECPRLSPFILRQNAKDGSRIDACVASIALRKFDNAYEVAWVACVVFDAFDSKDVRLNESSGILSNFSLGWTLVWKVYKTIPVPSMDSCELDNMLNTLDRCRVAWRRPL